MFLQARSVEEGRLGQPCADWKLSRSVGENRTRIIQWDDVSARVYRTTIHLVNQSTSGIFYDNYVKIEARPKAYDRQLRDVDRPVAHLLPLRRCLISKACRLVTARGGETWHRNSMQSPPRLH